MEELKNGLLTRRQALSAMAAATAGAVIRPVPVFGASATKKLRFALLGDWGTGDNACAGIANQMYQTHLASALDFVIAAGDNLYPDGGGRHLVKKFEQPFAGLLKERVNFYAVLGNHDVRDGRQDQCQYPQFNMGGQCYYTLKKGDGLAEFFMLDSTDFTRNQAAWVETALRESTAKWKIAVFHHPIYSSADTHGSSTGLRKVLEPLFTRYGVRAVFSGHDHIYERTKPQQGIQYFVAGAGGKVRKGDVDMKSPFREVTYDEDNHFMTVEIDDRQIAFRAIARSGKLVDSGLIR
ncbi:MAG TPA: metallophosphoesterase [Blastocatellia bacterium]|nr:metallophosphoesterase [Blastocatellia bacterium]HMX26538.1 metallophosphoesterase [Blastocatellia bacterium]HMZ19556.1 metallophosphoesterase [Blastocatellia bacterium]HNG29127.1 metallophosphoesterase [Blastocatellia bacterium]